MYEIARNSKKIRSCSSSRSSKVIDLGVNRKPIMQLPMDVSPTVFERVTIKARKWKCPVFSPLLCLKDGVTVRWTFHNPNFNRFRLHPCDGETDEQTDGDSIIARYRLMLCDEGHMLSHAKTAAHSTSRLHAPVTGSEVACLRKHDRL